MNCQKIYPQLTPSPLVRLSLGAIRYYGALGVSVAIAFYIVILIAKTFEATKSIQELW